MSHHINKTDTDRWFCIENLEDTIHAFGHVELGNIMDTGQPNLQSFLTENELEIYVNSILGPDYYKDAVEVSSPMFIGTSEEYEPITPLSTYEE